MRLFTNIFQHKMETRYFRGKLYLSVLIFLVLLNFTVADPRTHIPARVLAKQTGATQFEEERYETHADCNENKHHLKKRASDEDVDYEVYQGVVGRPGIDFPIYPRIPKTEFSCRSYGNGYFADMETDCQVFHICEEGRKISFLCPNGTIFQQSELTCDWWFKVNCLGSSGFYADSTELLNKQRVQRLKPSIPVQGFNIVGGGLDIKPRVPAKSTSRSRGGSDSAIGSAGNAGTGKGKGNGGANSQSGSGGSIGESGPEASNIHYNVGGSGSAGSKGPGSSNLHYNDGSKGPGASNTHYNDGNKGPGGSNIHYQDGSSGPGASNTRYKDGNSGPAASNIRYKDGNSGPAASNIRYKDGHSGPATSNVQYKDGNSGPGASNIKYKDGNSGPATINVQYKDGNSGPGASNIRYKDGNSGPDSSNTHYKDGNSGPGGSNIRYKDGNSGPDGSNEYYKAGNDGPDGSHYKVGGNGPDASHYKVGSNGPDASHYKVGSNGPDASHYKVGGSGPDASHKKAGGNGPDASHYKVGGSGPDASHKKAGGNGHDASHYKVGDNGPDASHTKAGGNGPDASHYKVGGNGPDASHTKAGGNGPDGSHYKVGGNGPDSSDFKQGNNGADSSNYKVAGNGPASNGNADSSFFGNGKHFSSGNTKSDRRIDSAEAPSLESVDFEDLSSEKQIKGSFKPIISTIDTNDNDESQITAESASFVSNRNRNSYNQEKTKPEQASKVESFKTEETARRGSGDRGSQRHGFGGEANDKTRGNQRGNQRFGDDKKSVDDKSRNSSEEKSNKKESNKNEQTPSDHTNKSNQFSASHNAGTEKAFKKEKLVDSGDKLNHPTPSYVSGTYTTARRLDSTRTTPYYTPTVPSVVKVKDTEGKSYYAREGSPTTPTPHRFNANNNGPSIFFEGAGGYKPATNVKDHDNTGATTGKPVIIGMRRNYNDKDRSVESLPSNHKNVDADYSAESTTPATTGPTYLPKSSAVSKSTHGSSGDSFLFAPITVPQDQVSRNVHDMLKTMNVIKTNFEDVELVKINGNGKNRSGLDIPASSGPDALISLAKYFATEQDDNNRNAVGNGNGKKSETKGNNAGGASSHGSVSASTTHTAASSSGSSNGSTRNSVLPKDKPSDTTATLTTEIPTSVAHNADQISSSLLSNSTVRKYNNLFGLDAKNSNSSETNLRSGLADPNAPKAHDIITPFPQIGPTDATIRTLAEKPESRQIAKVFSNALNNYLNDPVKFRDDLRSARPTEPPVDKKSNFVSVTDPTLFNHGTAATYLPTKPPSTFSSTQPNLAAVINSHLITSTGNPDVASTTEVLDSTTFKSSSERKHSSEFSGELEPPSSDSGEGEEILQREPTQSFVKHRNDLSRNQDKSGKLTTGKPAQKPWSFIEQDDILDPLKINDGLMKRPQQHKATTASPVIFLTGEMTAKNAARGQSHSLAGYQSRSKSSEQTEQYRDDAGGDIWGDIFDSYNLPKDSLPTTTGLQRIANKLFGGLDENEALHLKNVMAEAEHNRQILRLLLLLIQTCDDNNGKALERSRKSLLNALISMDAKLKPDSGKNSHVKQKPLTTTEKLPVTTYRKTGSGEEFTTSTLNYPSTTTDLPTTTLSGSTTTDAATSGEGTTTTKFAIIVEEQNDNDATITTTEAGKSAAKAAGSSHHDGNSDKRALELLKSLYSLASKFTSRR